MRLATMQTPRRGCGAQGCPGGAPSRMRQFLVVAVWFCAALSVAAGSFELTILHTNDVHARVEETSRDSGKCNVGQDCYGGVARRATKIQQIRATHRNVLLLDAGDQYQGTIWFSYFKGLEVVKFMNSLRYDAMVSWRDWMGERDREREREKSGEGGKVKRKKKGEKDLLLLFSSFYFFSFPFFFSSFLTPGPNVSLQTGLMAEFRMQFVDIAGQA